VGEQAADAALASARRLRREGKGEPEKVPTRVGITQDLPNEARLALLDLDVTAEEVRGKTLRWDATACAWLPDDEG
jgi:hypothetical protein